MKLGFQIANFTYPGGPARLGADLARLAGAVEQAGFDSLWVMDHYFQIEHIGPPEMDMLEGYSTLAYLAALTKKIKLGTMVTGCTYRYPGILAKTVTTLDVLSGGRAYFGVGAGWFEREHVGLGVPFPSTAERFERLEECLQIVLQMWSGERGPYSGKHYQLAETLCVPQPVSQPHPPILIGGMGEKKTLRLVAQYAQACNLFQMVGAPALKQKLAVLRAHCDDLGRDYSSIEKTTLGIFYPHKVSEFLEELHQLAEIGIDSALIGIPDPTDESTLEILASQVIPKAARYSSAGH